MTKLSCDVVKTWLEVLRESWTLGKDNIGLVLLQISGSISNCWNGKRWYFFQSPYLKLNSSRTRWWTSKMSSSIQNEVTFKVNSRSKISFFQKILLSKLGWQRCVGDHLKLLVTEQVCLSSFPTCWWHSNRSPILWGGKIHVWLFMLVTSHVSNIDTVGMVRWLKNHRRRQWHVPAYAFDFEMAQNSNHFCLELNSS